MNCNNCDYKKNAPNGICGIKKATDGFVLRCVGGWSKDKHYYLGKYIELFTKTMAKNKNWSGLCYIDLFTGPGKCMVRDYEEEIDGSPLIALKFPFMKFIFTELDTKIIDTLKNRSTTTDKFSHITFLQGDCNKQINNIIQHIAINHLSLAFIDPTGLDINFNTVQILTKNKSMDLIINFPEGMAIKRNLKQFIKSPHCKLDDFIGDKNWRSLFKQQTLPNEAMATRKIMNYYRSKLNKIGYKETKIGDEILIRSTNRNLPLYLLLFASKHPLGNKFWDIIGQIEPSGQRKLW